jgi:uncharacterized protein YcfJ
MKATRMASLIGGTLLIAAGAAQAGHEGELSWAKVVDVEPTYQYQTVQVPHEVCHAVQPTRTSYNYRDRRPDSFGPTLVGGLVGGLIGNRFGGGNGRDVMTVLGTVVGAGIANEHAQRRYSGPAYRTTSYRPARAARQCHTEYREQTEQVIDGYLVTYRFDGHEYTTHMNQHPGRRIRVAVDVVPVG